MRDVDDWIRDLKGPPAPSHVPQWPQPQHTRRTLGGLALAAAALLVAAVWTASDRGEPHARGGPPGGVTLDLRMVVDRGNVAVRATDGSLCRVGEQLFFRLSASTSTAAFVWVEGPGGRQPVGAMAVDPQPRDLSDTSGLVSYRLDVPGRHVFRASTEGMGRCQGCPSITLEVR